jgi:hypothetical protein
MREWISRRNRATAAAVKALAVTAALLGGTSLAYGAMSPGDGPYTYQQIAQYGSGGSITAWHCSGTCTADTCCRLIYVHT